MRQYAVIVIALVVLIGGIVARKYLTPAPAGGASEAEARALRAADALAAALAGGERETSRLDPLVAEVRAGCEALAAVRKATACGTLRGQAEALQRAARDQSIGDGAVQDVQTAVASLHGELGR